MPYTFLTETQYTFLTRTPRLYWNSIDVLHWYSKHIPHWHPIYIPHCDLMYIPCWNSMYILLCDSIYIPRSYSLYIPQWVSINIPHWDPVHTTPFSNENDTVLFRIRLPFTLQRSENGSFRKRSPEWNDLKTVLFENTVFLMWTAKTILLKTMTSPQQHNLALDHSTVSIQNSGQTLSDGFLVDRCDF